MRIGLLADTHLPGRIRHLDELGPEPADFFSSVELILHAGDLTSPIILDWLEQFAPVLCSTGNNDPIADSRSKDVQTLEIEGWRIGMVHSLQRQFRPMWVSGDNVAYVLNNPLARDNILRDLLLWRRALHGGGSG